MSTPVSPPPSRVDAVQLFCTCLVNDFYPEVGKAAVELLESQGVELLHEVPSSGPEGRYVAFVDPFGTVHELVEPHSKPVA